MLITYNHSRKKTDRDILFYTRASIKYQKRKFLVCGVINIGVTTSVLQLALIALPVAVATFASQVCNACLGYLLYGNVVFRSGQFKKSSIPKYAITAMLLWCSNTLAITVLESYANNRNLAALVALPFIAAISYVLQKYWVFR